uniref:Kunitz/Bovine pancreatic trypsin inhibitor domain protein n=1 Tax=Haemonchus contortus TaxID=6289 RepID=A0A7I4YF01_HAECO
MISLLIFYGFLSVVAENCHQGQLCESCDFFRELHNCQSTEKIPHFLCKSGQIFVNSSGYLLCEEGLLRLFGCQPGTTFELITKKCVKSRTAGRSKRRRRTAIGSSLVGDVCSFNTDCQQGMFCSNGNCQCLSDFVAVEEHCWPKINPGESGCVNSKQCDAVWPDAICSTSGVCECPSETVPSRTRDGTVCISSLIPPSCPLPEPHNGIPNPATVLANPSTHPLNPGGYMPVLCTSTSTEIHRSNGGDGSTWCVYPDGNNDIFVADIYDCISHPQVTNVLFPEFHDTVDGICCQNRAFVCVQPMESGDEPSVPRWWFNSATGSCVQFTWDPTTIEGASPNNFRTVDHCESYCRDTCKRGAVEFTKSSAVVFEEQPKSGCLSSGSRCSHDHECVLIGSSQTCCPSTAHLCGPYGGRQYISKPILNYDRGVAIASSKSTTRYYYDVERSQCVSFVYHGLGNFNNFVTKQECEVFCSRLVCANGSPLRIGEDWQRCEASTECPSSHFCSTSHRVCCPSAQSICTQPKQPGDCTSTIRRYWYNAVTRQCEMFHYTGCHGNDNSFHSLVACQQQCKGIRAEPKCPNGRAYRDHLGKFVRCSPQTRCPPNYVCSYDGLTHGCCPTKAFTCSLAADKGVRCGLGRSYRYFFNAAKQACESFHYEGCDGNSNNFLTAQHCEQYCGVGGCPNGGFPLQEEKSVRPVACSGLKGCPSTHECVGIPSKGNVAHRCCPTKEHICSQPPLAGSQCSSVTTSRYYFNLVTRQCTSFHFNGCSGNLNNFATKELCNNFCSSAACELGETVLKDPGTSRPFRCNSDLRNSCPPKYQCRFSKLLTYAVCCGSPVTDHCPEGERPYMVSIDETVKECSANIPGSCPAQFLCRFNLQKNKYYCCAPDSENFCPEGRALFRSRQTSLPHRCVLNSLNECSAGFSCQSRIKGVTQGFCCTERSVCKGDAQFIVDDGTKMPRICTPGLLHSCPLGYHCQLPKPQSTNGFCCKVDVDVITEGCPPTEYALTDGKKVVECDPFNSSRSCPAEFSCQFAVLFQRYQCCGKIPPDGSELSNRENGCLSNQVALLERDRVVVCTASGNTCPSGYFCQFSTKNQQFQCCGIKSDCPGKSMAFLNLDGEAKQCAKLSPSCPAGFSCQQTKHHKFLCCTIEGTSVKSAQNLTNFPATQTYLNVTKTPTVKMKPHTVGSPCNGSTVLVDGTCKKIGKQMPCFLRTQCPTGLECINFVCAKKDEKTEVLKRPACAEGSIMINGRCIHLVEVNGRCSANEQCQGGSKCHNKTCSCGSDAVLYKGVCRGKSADFD